MRTHGHTLGRYTPPSQKSVTKRCVLLVSEVGLRAELPNLVLGPKGGEVLCDCTITIFGALNSMVPIWGFGAITFRVA
jgi:hypothetical protein